MSEYLGYVATFIGGVFLGMIIGVAICISLMDFYRAGKDSEKPDGGQDLPKY